ncbi:diacylglycerol kinase [Bacillus sp. AFS076308]|uniref:diacylglycerol kinase family protein n=1 Tax=unclassified Bacillus (in: firmicutes) TaxID=185979 RepID=UPI000BFA5787|nr:MULTISPECIES: diacylglycerol kinase family protein [unclassified Bacillus (in: firmicutes)]PFO03675.1 diacylglycerol kinase [Bacillus sp. AFS076308]PGV54406.1 diacylglycerol kinase [Bacillus sp. AFS037270]
MDSHDKRKRFVLLNSFSYAVAGILTAAQNERNMRFHLISSLIVLVLSFYFSISKLEWIFILFAIGGMFALELMNTAIERVVDLVTAEFHPLAKQAKDIAAGAVFIYSILTVIVGIIIFLPYVLKQF